jgi:Cu/Ag efflux protein CusF
MKLESRPLRAALLLLVLPVALAAASRVHRGHGVVLELREGGKALLIRHDAIAGFMPAMTMTFAVSDPKLVKGLTPGQGVEFTLTKRGYRWPITALRRDPPGPRPAPTAPPHD